MSSILTNNGAMVALQTLKSINGNLATTQSEISTGKSVSSAKDNAAVWAIAKTMEADVKGFTGITYSLNLGQSTVAVARSAAETVTELLTDIKGKIVSAQEENVDRAKIQTDIDALRDQIGAVVGAAQFNGLNLLSNTDTTEGSGGINVLASLDRSSSGVTASDIRVAKQDLGTGAEDWSVGTELAAGNVAATAISGGIDNATAVNLVNNTTTLVIDTATAGTGVHIEIAAGTATNGLDGMNGTDYELGYIARDGDTQEDVANAIATAFNDKVQGLKDAGTLASTSTLGAAVTTAADGVATITFTSHSTSTGADDTISLQAFQTNGAQIGGRLEALNDIDVTTQSGVDTALTDIEGLLQTAVDSASAFGSVQGRIETQTDFITSLTDSLKSGIGTLVDADMEEASARLQALQVQQQLGVQALSIANQAPQQLLSLFR